MPFCPFHYNFRNGQFGIDKDRQKLPIIGKNWQICLLQIGFRKNRQKFAKIGKIGKFSFKRQINGECVKRH